MTTIKTISITDEIRKIILYGRSQNLKPIRIILSRKGYSELISALQDQYNLYKKFHKQPFKAEFEGLPLVCNSYTDGVLQHCIGKDFYVEFTERTITYNG